jgi:pseudouridine-5'-phosphate glycosidase
MKPLLTIAPAVRQALEAGRPVVALESTIIAHGMPFPHNLETARRAQSIAQEEGCVAATIAALDGSLCVGLEDAELELLAQAQGVLKISRRDLAYALASGRPGATTVSATMMAAAMAGIRVFATGGIGGVHRGAGPAGPAGAAGSAGPAGGDVSADLTELGRTPVVVVSAGAKAILDLALTLELLETLGVPVVGYGTDEFPAFYSRSSGLPVAFRLDTPGEVAALYRKQRELGLEQGLLVANPVPREHEIPRPEVEAWITTALGEAARAGVRGKDVTPFLLGRVVEASGGRALETNKRLLESNVRVACAVARELPPGGS